MKIFYYIIFFTFIIISGCSSESVLIKKYKTVYEPINRDSMTSYYVSGIPFGAYENDKYSMIFTVRATNILDEEYLTFWVLLKNKNDEEYLLEPTKIFDMSVWKAGKKLENVSPVSPLEILRNVEYSKQAEIALAAIGSALKTISAKSINSVERESERLERKVNNISNWYDLYSESLNDGILRRNTIFKDKSVNGIVYFLPSDEIPKSEKLAGSNYEIGVTINLPNEKKEFKFKPVAGE
ncbi:MAG: hypothetical protein K1X86_15755 [Ignavibacteria bacterium]|nr:hypothetical protein [Ignavibacteria bacterium]